MPALSIIAISPAAPRESFREPALAIAAARAGAVGVLDLEYVSQVEAAQVAFTKLVKHAGSGGVGLRCRSGHLPNLASLASPVAVSGVSAPARSLDPSTVNGSWILILTASGGRFEPSMLSSDISEAKANGYKAVVEAIDVNEALMAQNCGADAVIAKGHEGAGRIGDGTTFVLVQQFVRALNVPVWAQGGIGLHSAAAVVAAGASGIVLDAQLYLCRDSLITAPARQRLEKMDGSETTVLQGPDGQFRLFAENGSARLAQLQAALLGQNSYALVHALQANVHAQATGEGDEFWLIGQDACFARHLARVGVTISGAIEAIRQSVASQIEIASKSSVLAENSDLAVSHGTRYPIIQGAMTRVSDNSDFAYEVAKAGGLPFLALSLMRAADIEILLQETADKLGSMPWGVGLLGFVPPALRQEQMTVVDKFKPPFALIAGGRPDQAKAMEDAGTKTYLHVPSPLLLKSFIEMGSRRFIFEGKECGGHVGPRSSFVLWQSMIEVLLDSIGPRDNASAFHVLFAGGIHDQMSAAMVATLTAPLTARGIKVGFLVGTAYLFTEEAVRTGAIVDKFQQAALQCNETVLLETGPGHSIRCIDSPYKEIFDKRRVELQGQNKSRDEVREELELMNLGRLRIASKGLGRNESNQMASIPDEQQWQEGMYMIGQVAALHDKVMSIAELHHDISAEGQSLLSAREIEQLLDAPAPEKAPEAIAIVGMSCQFPQSNDVETYWANILGKVDSITEIPKTHFEWQNYFDANPLARDKIISKWGGFLNDVVFDPAAYGIPPSSLDSIDPMQMLILEAARSALHDAGYNERKFPRDKTSVILANAGHGPITALYSLRSMLGWKLNELGEEVTDKLKGDLPEWTEDSFAGYLGNVAAGRVANRLDLKGINFSIDAACASSLAALYVGISDLRSKASDVVLLGATDTHNQPGDYLSFSKTHALSPTGKCKTFDATADGIAISEGIAILVLKRLSDAERDGDRIYAVIRGIGGSSDGRDLSLTAPRPAGQMLALQRAYADANISPATVQIVEAHGTGTVAGDRAEVEALTNVFRASGAELESCAIGSVKTNIGHSKAAAGLASIIKIAKALHHKVLPPTINVINPSPACKFSEGPFYVNTESRPWVSTDNGQPRRGGVSAFGFGGTNFHAVLEEYVAPCAPEAAPVLEAWPAELFIWKANSSEDLIKLLAHTEANVKKLRADFAVETDATSQGRRRLFELAINLHQKTKDVRGNGAALAIVATSAEDLEQKIALVKEKIQKGEKKFTLPTGIHFNAVVNAAAPASNKVAFLFPGQGSQKVNMLKELSVYFPEILNTIEAADRYLGHEPKAARFKQRPLSRYIFPPATLSDERKQKQQEELTRTDIAQPALGVSDVAMLQVLKGFAVTPDMVAGHSYGEYVALYAGGVYSAEDLLLLSAERGRILAQCAESNPGAMAAISAAPEVVAEAVKNMPGVYLANINTPAQTIISGSIEAVEAALGVFQAKQIAGKRIPVSAAFHSPLMSGSDKQLEAVLQGVKCNAPAIPVYSNSTAQAYPAAAAAIIEQLSQHALKPVFFVDQIKAMHAAGARLFVEVGPGSVLTGLVEATLAGSEFVAVNCERAGRNSLEHFLSMLGQLAVNGASVDLGKLFWNRMFSNREKIRKHLNSNGKQMLYKVNSVEITRIGADGQRVIAPAKAAVKAVVAKTAATATAQQNSSIATSPVAAAKSYNPSASAASQPALQPTTASLAKPNKQHLTDVPNRTNGQPPMETNSRRNGNQPARQDQNVDRVMLEFQQSMLEMTNRFLETQQNVMLAYLQANGRGNGIALPVSQAMQQVGQVSQGGQQANPQPVQVADQHAVQNYATQTMAPAQYADGNGNGANSGNGNGANGNGHGSAAVVYGGTGTNGNGNGAYGGNGNGNGAGNNGNGNGHGAVISLGEDTGAHAVHAASTAEATGDSATGDSEGINPEALIESLYEIVSERTGYPRSMLDPTLDLEADLGIDSIKRVEILNNFRKLLPEATQTKLESGIEKLAGTKTLQGIIDWISTLDQIDDQVEGASATTDSGAAAATTTLAKISSAAASGSQAKVAAVGNVERVARGVVAQEELPAVKATTKPLPNLTVIVADQQEPAKQVATLLDARGQKSILINRKTMIDEASVNQVITQIKENYGRVGAVVNICSVNVDAAQLSNTFLLAKAVEADLRDEAVSGSHAAFVNVTYLGGNFAGTETLPLPTLAQQGGIVGLTKTIAKEWANVHVKVVDLSSTTSTETAAMAIVGELIGDDNIVEVGCFQNKRMGLVITDSAFATLPVSTEPALTSSSVVLVTGGARGITAKITLDLARKYKPTFVIVGRLPRPKDSESKVTFGLNSAKDIKSALIEEKRSLGQAVNVREIEQIYQHLLREREVRSSLEALKAAGATVRYYSVDISDAAAFGQLIDSIYETATIDGVIHGAGIIEDALIKDKTLESFERVYNTKIKGAITLAEKIRFDSLKFMYFFSSIVGRTGNSGQADYVSANEALNKLALTLKSRTKAQVASLMWGPWQAGMAPPELEAVFASHGWAMIQPEDGSLCFMEELNRRSPEQVEIVLVGKLAGPGGGGSTKSELLAPTTSLVPAGVFLNVATVKAPSAFALTVDTKAHLYLNDHKFDGIPVMPMAAALEIMLEAARSVYPNLHLVEVSDLDIPAGIVFHTQLKDFIVEVGIDSNDKNIVAVSLSSADPKKTHFRCKTRFAATAVNTPEIWNTVLASKIQSKFDAKDLAPSSVALPDPADLYGTWLFHGPTFQGISSITSLAADEISGEISGCAPINCVTTTDGSQWLVDPVLLDSAMQLAGIWARHHQDVTVLPTGFRNMYLFNPVGLGIATAKVFLSAASATDLLCDLAIYNEEGDLALVVEGLGGIASKTFNRFASSAPVQELAR